MIQKRIDIESSIAHLEDDVNFEEELARWDVEVEIDASQITLTALNSGTATADGVVLGTTSLLLTTSMITLKMVKYKLAVISTQPALMHAG